MNAPAKPAPRADASASQEAVLQVALKCFVEQGFHGTSMRDIAGRAGTSIAAIYYHFPSKAALLRAIMTRVTEDLLAVLQQARSGLKDKDDPASLLAALVRAYVRFHTEHREEAFVGNSELRSLGAEDLAHVIALRDEVSAQFNDAIALGLDRGAFACAYPREAGLAVLTMCTAVANWYRPGGPASPEQIADRYAALALAMVGAR
ncbi:MAG: TetR family transcriptional regulator [Reyranellaceae bacterium]